MYIIITASDEGLLRGGVLTPGGFDMCIRYNLIHIYIHIYIYKICIIYIFILIYKNINKLISLSLYIYQRKKTHKVYFGEKQLPN